MKLLTQAELSRIAKSGSLSASAAQYELDRREKKEQNTNG